MRGMNRTPNQRFVWLLYILAFPLLFVPTAARADVVSDWNTIAVNTAVAAGQSPFVQGRTLAMVQIAVFEAVNAVQGGYRPYLGTITAPAGASAEAAAIEAAYQVLKAIIQDPVLLSVLNIDHTSALGDIPDSQAKTDGIQTGGAAAAAIVALRASDGSQHPQFGIPGPALPGVWQPTASCPTVNGIKVGVGFYWQNVTPFGIPSVSSFLLDPPPALTSEEYTEVYDEVMTVGRLDSIQRPPDRTNVALFYAAATPVQVFNMVAQQVAAEQGRSLLENARALALINMAMNDSLEASFYNKYHYNFWRPETAIHGGDTDGNPDTLGDTSWTPLIKTPCFPSYPSNHGSAANAAAAVLRRLYGEGGHSITLTNPTVPTINLQYDAFKEITDDISDARVYAGIHFRSDQRAGGLLGRAIGRAVYWNNLQPLDGRW